MDLGCVNNKMVLGINKINKKNMIILTGASRGIGHFLMNAFIKDGVEVLGLYNNSIPKENKNLMFKVDISNSFEIKNFIESHNELLKQITLINCAGSNYNAYAHKADPEKWATLIRINLIGTFLMINAVLPIMREQNFGRIINFSSVVAQSGIIGTSAYAASKAGLWGMTKAIAVENASKNITINNLNLGYFDLGMINDVPIDMQEKIKSKIPVQKFGNPIDIYRSVKYLMEVEYLTGTSIDLNGGLF